jgi:hypothetical protein
VTRSNLAVQGAPAPALAPQTPAGTQSASQSRLANRVKVETPCAPRCGFLNRLGALWSAIVRYFSPAAPTAPRLQKDKRDAAQSFLDERIGNIEDVLTSSSALPDAIEAALAETVGAARQAWRAGGSPGAGLTRFEEGLRKASDQRLIQLARGFRTEAAADAEQRVTSRNAGADRLVLTRMKAAVDAELVRRMPNAVDQAVEDTLEAIDTECTKRAHRAGAHR